MKFLKVCDFISDFKNDFLNHKVVVLKSGLTDLDRLNTFFVEAANQVGISVICDEDPTTGELILNKWNEIKYVQEMRDVAYKFSDKNQPLHTDYVNFSIEIFCSFFYCLKQAEFGGATVFVDADTIVRILKEVDPTLFQAIQSHKIQFGTSANPITQNKDLILSKDELGWRINWNYYRCLTDYENLTLIEDFRAFLTHYIENSGEMTAIKLQVGEGVFFHDTRVLHGRNSFVGNRHLNKAGIVKSLPVELLKFFSNSN
jgi:alpha-ketoglutarate-dependent taurine dioxygenase